MFKVRGSNLTLMAMIFLFSWWDPCHKDPDFSNVPKPDDPVECTRDWDQDCDDISDAVELNDANKTRIRAWLSVRTTTAH